MNYEYANNKQHPVRLLKHTSAVHVENQILCSAIHKLPKTSDFSNKILFNIFLNADTDKLENIMRVHEQCDDYGDIRNYQTIVSAAPCGEYKFYIFASFKSTIQSICENLIKPNKLAEAHETRETC